jgi:hypothetical protein
MQTFCSLLRELYAIVTFGVLCVCLLTCMCASMHECMSEYCNDAQNNLKQGCSHAMSTIHPMNICRPSCQQLFSLLLPNAAEVFTVTRLEGKTAPPTLPLSSHPLSLYPVMYYSLQPVDGHGLGGIRSRRSTLQRG